MELSIHKAFFDRIEAKRSEERLLEAARRVSGRESIAGFLGGKRRRRCIGQAPHLALRSHPVAEGSEFWMMDLDAYAENRKAMWQRL